MPFRVLATLAVLVAVTAGPLGTPVGSAAPALTMDEAVRAYAPVVHLHKEERLLPTSANTFVNNSKLIWHHDSKCDDDPIREPFEPRRLSGKVPARPYTHQTKSSNKFGFGCKHGGRQIASNEDVRPRDRDNAADAEGFFLDLDNFLRPGFGLSAKGTVEAPVYFSVHGDAIVYWFLYGYNEAPAKKGTVPTHEGDWENVTVLLDRNHRATDVVFAGHGRQCSTKAPQGRPHIYSARGSHASYPKPGDYPHDKVFVDHAGKDGPTWNSDRELIPLQAQDWYGYGGGWGEVGDDVPGAEPGSTTGPQGPHPEFKTGLPNGPLGACPEPQ